MAQPATTDNKPQPAGSETGVPNPEPASLKGAFVSVMLLGAFLALAWVSVFILYVHRS
ncbi:MULTISPECIES: hypothetical protein [Cohnella]|jgi:hypothetical protein|uniref:hypothetical protein n=1 Tax=Cohnella TaxID=329857 RepID=UPI0003811DA2|nr:MULTISPECIES: hypothetical protein [Cohnella]REK66595.1 MAG: cytochrome c oxidase subunit 2A [Cohnella sp.]